MSVASPAGYSGKPIWQKLGLAPSLRVHVRNPPHDYADVVGLPPDQLQLVDSNASFDLAHVFVTRANDLAAALAELTVRLPTTGTLWVSWPKRAAGVSTDFSEDTIRELALPLGIVDVKVCAIDATWSALKLVWRKEKRL